MWGVGSLFNSCTCSTSHAPAAIWFACFQFIFSMSHFKVRENEIVGGGNCRTGGVIFVQIYNISCTCGKSNYIFLTSQVIFLFNTSRQRDTCRCGVLVVCSIHAHVQHLMHLRQSGLHVFSLYFPCPTSRFGKMKLWVVA